MTDRTCDFCRWWDRSHSGLGVCRRFPPVAAQSEVVTGTDTFCGEWSDASITPEEEDLQELIRRFAVAIMSAQWAANCPEGQVWAVAASLAAAEPQIQREVQQ